MWTNGSPYTLTAVLLLLLLPKLLSLKMLDNNNSKRRPAAIATCIGERKNLRYVCVVIILGERTEMHSHR